ncbi:GHMP kinase [bacterium]|nr:GHMP kinase [bacterium]
MIISRTPFRISFSGGGTDLREFYQHDFGAVTSTAINKYMYITVNKRFDHTIRVSYSKTEIVDSVEQIHHPIVREALKKVGLKEALEIVSVADIPSQAGLGSSSSFTVGLLHALYAYKGEFISAERLAKEACELEIEVLREPIGKQDQYIAAFGGLQNIRFNSDETVFVDPVICSTDRKQIFNSHLLMFYTGQTRAASSILNEQKKQTVNKFNFLKQMRDYAFEISSILTSDRDISEIGKLLDASWQLKRSLTETISNVDVDKIYALALQNGALGGKLLGAGGGGFILLFAEPNKQKELRQALGFLQEVIFSFEPQGSKIIYVGH